MKNTSHKRPEFNRRDYFRKLSDSELLFLLEAAEVEVQRVACHELGRRHIKEAVALLVRRLESADLTIREAAADALGMIGDPQAGPALLELFADNKQPEQIRDTCAYALARLVYRPALPKLLAALSDPSSTVRSCAVAALAAIGEPQTRQLLEMACVTESNDEVRAAMRALIEELPTVRRPKLVFGTFERYERKAFEALSIGGCYRGNYQAFHHQLVGRMEAQLIAFPAFLRSSISITEGHRVWRDARRSERTNTLSKISPGEQRQINYGHVIRSSAKSAADEGVSNRIE